MRPRNPARVVAFSGVFQLTITVSFLRSGCTPLGPNNAPANTISVIKNLHLLAERDRFLSLKRVNIQVSLSIISLNVFAAVPPSSTNSSMVSSARRLYMCLAVMLANVEGVPVSLKGILLYQK